MLDRERTKLMAEKKPKFYVTWDKSGMYLWLGQRPSKKWATDLYESDAATRMHLPISWFGGLVNEGGCREFDPEAALPLV